MVEAAKIDEERTGHDRAREEIASTPPGPRAQEERTILKKAAAFFAKKIR